MADPDRQAPLKIFLAFAQDHFNPRRHLRHLPAEEHGIREALKPAERAGLCTIIPYANVTPKIIWDVFQENSDNRIAIFHFGGHANSTQLLLEASDGGVAPVFAAGLARFLGQQRGLAFVFLNACASESHVEALLDAGVTGVVATSVSILDNLACTFAVSFYTALAEGATLGSAFVKAESTLRGELGEDPARAVKNERGADHSRWPWQLYLKQGVGDLARSWSLPQAADDPLYGLPTLPPGKLPGKPYKHLSWFEQGDAEIFFGRGKDIRRLYVALTEPTGQPIVLLYGESGVGKSSLLDAGLRPRLTATHDIHYQRHKRSTRLTEALLTALGEGAESPLQSWQERERQGKPLIVILDQLEEAWMGRDDPVALANADSDRAGFIGHLRELFHATATRPQGRLLLSFRKEWLAEVCHLLDADQLPYARQQLDQLDHAGIVEAIRGPTLQTRLQNELKLQIDKGLPERIADRLLSDSRSAIAPTLQILLATWWQDAFAEDSKEPKFRTSDYLARERAGLLLKDFVGEQLEVLRAADSQSVDSGLIFDLLQHHTTPYSSADAHSVADLHARYGKSPELDALVERCVGTRLLMPAPLSPAPASNTQLPAKRAATRLSHDTLAPLIRALFEQSLRPGQRATRILEQRAGEWKDGKIGAVLDDFDLATVEAGIAGMRLWTKDEQRLVASSREARRKRRLMRRVLTIAGVVAILTIVVVSTLALNSFKDAHEAKLGSRDRSSAAIATSLSDPADRLLTLLEIGDVEATPTAQDQLSNVLNGPVSALVFEKADRARFDRSGSRILSSWRETGHIWNIGDADKPVQTITGKAERPSQTTETSGDPYFPSIVFNEAGDQFLSLGDTGVTAVLWDVNDTTASRQTFEKQGDPGDWVVAAAFSKNGKRVLTASNSGKVFLWDVGNGKAPEREFKGHEGRVTSVMFNVEGNRVLTASWDRTAKLWDIDDVEKPRVTFEVKSFVNFAAFDVKGDQILTADEDGYTKLWDIDNGAAPVSGFGRHQGPVNSAVFNPAGNRVLTASDDNTAKLWDIENEFVALQTFSEEDSAVKAAFFNEAGDQVLTTSGSGVARLYYLEAGKIPLKTFKSNSTPLGRTLSVNAAGNRVLKSSGKRLLVWDIDNDVTPLHSFLQTGLVTSATFGPNGNRLAATSADGVLQVRDIDNGAKQEKKFSDDAEVYSAVFNGRDDQVLLTSNRGAQLWNLSAETVSGKVFDVDAKVVFAVSSATGDRILTISDAGGLRLWRNHDSLNALAQIDMKENTVLRPIASDLSASGDLVLTTSDSGATYLRAADDLNNVLKTFKGPQARVFSATFNSAGNRVLVAYGDGTARLWNVDNDQVPLQTFAMPRFGKVTRNAARDAVFTPDGDHILIASDDGKVRLWPVSGEALKAVARSRTRRCLSAASLEHAVGETIPQAEVRHSACKACVPEYFDVLGRFPAGSIEGYRQAWNHYKRCYGQHTESKLQARL